MGPSKIGTMRIPLFHLNAFTDRPFSGNPAAVCLLDSWLDDGWLRKVAAENNLSATAFLVPSGEGYELRWFTPACEVRLCGHATLAAGYVVCHILKPAVNIVSFKTRFRGNLTVKKDEKFFLLDFPALSPDLCNNPPRLLQQALGTDRFPLEVLEANNSYIAVLESEDAVRDLRPELALVEQLHPFVVAVTAPGKDSDFVSRYFAPTYGVPEDPVTGSLHCSLAPYWSRRLGKSRLQARQLSERGGELWCELAGERVILKGETTLTMQGSLLM
jgi:PhzF family phenazine biosynthesis protein